MATSGVRRARIEIAFDREVEADRIRLEEPIWLGQRIDRFALSDGSGRELATGTTIGPRRVLAFPRVRTRRLELTLESDRAEPALYRIVLSASR